MLACRSTGSAANAVPAEVLATFAAGVAEPPVYSVARRGRAPTARGVSPARSCRRDKPPNVPQATAAASGPPDQALPRQHTPDRSCAWHSRWRHDALAAPGSARGASNKARARNFRSLALCRWSGGRWRCHGRHYLGTAAIAGACDDLLLVGPWILRLLDVGTRQGSEADRA